MSIHTLFVHLKYFLLMQNISLFKCLSPLVSNKLFALNMWDLKHLQQSSCILSLLPGQSSLWMSFPSLAYWCFSALDILLNSDAKIYFMCYLLGWESCWLAAVVFLLSILESMLKQFFNGGTGYSIPCRIIPTRAECHKMSILLCQKSSS